MRNSKRNFILTLLGAALCAASIVFFSSCERIYDDLEPCPHGVSLRFVYDYNMLYANAFPSSVDCLTLYIYDENGNYVDTKVVTGAELQDENYRMILDLEEGTYRFVAYGGLACGEKTFSVLREPSAESMHTDLQVGMDVHRVAAPVPSERRLHDMFWGELTLTTAELYNEGTVKMMKNTNNIRIILQQESGEAVDVDDFLFEITDNNSLFAYDNDLVTDGQLPVTYKPWVTGQAYTGVSIVGNNVAPKEVTVAYAEISTSRLMTKNSPRLLIKRKSDGATIVDFPIINYLVLLRSDYYKFPPYNMTDDQEYLDRESHFSLFFFLRPDQSWINTRIVVNDWVVRINNAEL